MPGSPGAQTGVSAWPQQSSPARRSCSAGNGFRCPLTELAERYGAEHGSVTDIYLPGWFAHNMPAVHAPLLMLMGYLHARNLIRPAEPSRQPIPRWTGSDSYRSSGRQDATLSSGRENCCGQVLYRGSWSGFRT